MRILLIHNQYQSKNVGGEDIVFKNEVEFLQKNLGKENVFLYEISNDNINRLKLMYQIWFSFFHYRNIKKIVVTHHIDLVHIHNFFPLLTPSVFKAAKDGGAKVIHTLHNYRFWCISGIFYRNGFGVCERCIIDRFSFAGIINKCYRKSLLQSVVAQMAFWFYQGSKVFDNIDYFFVLTNFQKEKVQALGIDKNKIILKPNTIKINFDIQKDKKNYVYVGRLEESKGIYELLDVWSTLNERFVLTIIGGGDIEEKLRNQYHQSNIIFKGKCSRKETLRLIASSRYLIQPSLLYETFGLTIIEAMSFGVPVIGFDIGTRRDFIQNGINGFLCDTNELKKVIENSIDYQGYNNLSKNAIETAKLYENEHIIKNQIEVYKSIMEKY